MTIDPESAVVTLQNRQLPILAVMSHSFVLTPVGLFIDGNPTLEEWETVGVSLRAFERASRWLVGDWVMQGEYRYGEKYAQAMEATEYSKQGLADIVWVCRQYPVDQRRADLSFEHHRIMAPFPAEMRNYFFDLAAQYNWNGRQLRQARDNFLETGVAAPDEDLAQPLEQPQEERPGARRPRLLISSTAHIAKVTDGQLLLDLERLPADAVPPGTEVYVHVVVMPPA